MNQVRVRPRGAPGEGDWDVGEYTTTRKVGAGGGVTAGFKGELGTACRLGHREIYYQRIQELSVTADQVGMISVLTITILIL